MRKARYSHESNNRKCGKACYYESVFVNFLTKNNTNEVIITRCIPETTIKNEVPVNEKSSLTLESRAVFAQKNGTAER